MVRLFSGKFGVQYSSEVVYLQGVLMQLRDYQQLAVQHSLQRIQDGCLRMYEVLPTGTGKGVILASVAKQRLQAGRILVLIHRQDIAVQLVKVLEQAELNVGLLMQGHRDLEHRSSNQAACDG
jgi:superfamily II DNA or RNA helicase